MSSVPRAHVQRMVELTESYAARPVFALGTWRCGDWRIKEYAIAYRREAARPELIEAAKAAAEGDRLDPLAPERAFEFCSELIERLERAIDARSASKPGSEQARGVLGAHASAPGGAA